ncbi:MAG: hypothetical protein JW388_1442 [Nitrospira sp.]|nr:hypothetical protein [Nitrospira sp.]
MNRSELDLELKFIDLRARGASFSSISAELRISKNTAIKLGQKLASETREARAMALQEIRERYQVQAIQRSEAFAEALAAVIAEIRERLTGKEKLSEISFSELIKLCGVLSREVESSESEIESPIFDPYLIPALYAN